MLDEDLRPQVAWWLRLLVRERLEATSSSCVASIYWKMIRQHDLKPTATAAQTSLIIFYLKINSPPKKGY